MQEEKLTPLPPPDCARYKSTPVFDQSSVPKALLRSHDTKAGVWAVVRVLDGDLVFELEDPRRRQRVAAGETVACPPEAPHRLEIDGPVRFQVEFWRAAP